MTLGERIRARRKALGLSQVELAKRSPHLDANLISRWERDLNVPRVSSLQELAGALEVSVDELAGYSIDLAERIVAIEERLAALERRA